jgi:hypothetical protein
LTARDSVERFWRRESTEIPMVGASLRGIPASCISVRPIDSHLNVLIFHTFNSVRVKPRPARTRRLYLMVGHRTMGLNLSIGRGATAADFARRALRRLNLRPGCVSCQTLFFIFCAFCARLPGRSELEPVVANPCGNLPFKSAFCPVSGSQKERDGNVRL